MDFKRFRNPDTILRPAPFWAINDRVTPQEAARQMGDMIDVGLSGGFFHSRSGLITDYLGDGWFAAIDAALDVARAKDGYLWLYDEDLWASGNAGGQVAAADDEYQLAALKPEMVPVGATPLPDGEDLFKAAYVIEGRSGASISSAKQISRDEAQTRTDCERIIIRRHYHEKTAWWGGESYPNSMNPDAVGLFIKLTHEVYKKRLGHEFGKRIPGIFTDEPNIWANGTCAGGLTWWEGIPGVYSKWHGRDFWADLPYLFFDGPSCRKIRLLIHRTLLRQFVEAYSKPIYEWCEANNLKMTGHYFEESDFDYQIQATSGGIMAHYRYQHIPGIDHLCRQVDNALLSAKQVGSAARQLGRPQVLTELFGVSRHTTTFGDFKWIGDFSLVLGPNFFCPHLSLYSARGRRKRDYPPNWNYQQTYWHELNPLNDYFTRVAQVLTNGTAKPDVLILHPIESGTAAHRLGLYPLYSATGSENRLMPADLPAQDLSQSQYCCKMFRKTLEAVLNAGYDADLGDENFIEEMGSVEGPLFSIGEMSYPVVIVPPSQTWRPRTFTLLREFVDNGGKLILLGALPSEIDCDEAHDQWEALAASDGVQTIPCAVVGIQSAVERVSERAFTLRDLDGRSVNGTYLQHRADGEQEFFFIVNSDRERSQRSVLELKGGSGREVAFWNPLDGSRSIPETRTVGGNLRIEFSLQPVGSVIVAIGPGVAGPDAASGASACERVGDISRLPSTWKFTRSEPNVLVMDRISYSLDGGATWSAEDSEYRIRRALAERFGTREALDWQPWVAVRKGLFDGKGGDVILRYRFTSEIEGRVNASLVVENLAGARLRVNGSEVSTQDPAWHWDHSFHKVEIGELIRRGGNTVEIGFDYNFLSEVETAYVVGDFGVRLANPREGVIVDEPGALRDGSWVDQGYPFYSGTMTYQATLDSPGEGRKTKLRLVNPSAILCKARVNGQEAGKLLWRPWELDITQYLKRGANSLEIDVVSSVQNSLGPLHEREGDDNLGCGPNAFENEGELRQELSLFDHGLLGGVEILTI